MVKNSNTSYENDPFQRGFQKYKFLAREALILGEGRPENLGKVAKNRGSIVMQIREWSILVRNTGLYSLVPKSLHCFGFPICQIKLRE